MKKFRKSIAGLLSIILVLTSFNLNSNSIQTEAASDTWTYDYTGSVETFTAPYTGKYYLDIYGASGGGSYSGGGHSYGYINLYAGDKLYIAVGQEGSVSSAGSTAVGGYNGGGSAHDGAGSGGGATSITTTNRGELKNFENYKSEVLIVAGGSGGKGSLMPNNKAVVTYTPDKVYKNIIDFDDESNETKTSGGGGGTAVNDWTATKGAEHVFSTNGTDKFGQGEDGVNTNYFNGYPGAGGGGYYGGTVNRGHSGSTTGMGSDYSIGILGGSGGLGYINEDVLLEASTVKGAEEDNFIGNKGDGKATITYIGSVQTTLTIDTKSYGKVNGTNGKVTITGTAGSEITFPTITPISSSYELQGYTHVYGNLTSANGYISASNIPSKYKFTFENTLLEADWECTKINVVITKQSSTSYRMDIDQTDSRAKYFKVLYSKNNGSSWSEVEASDTGAGSSGTYAQKFYYSGTSNTSGNIQSYEIPATGYYYIQATGASGTCNYATCTYDNVRGGFASGYRFFNQGDVIYIAVGGRGSSGRDSSNGRQSGGWNGGGYGHDHSKRYVSGGGGATSITTTSRGVLTEYKNYKSEVILVAGGAGGPLHALSHVNYPSGNYGGAGGGLSGGNGTSGATGGSQSSAGTGGGFGYGAYNSSSSKDYGGGGGGWYGGGYSTSDDGGGAGGSSYIGGVFNGSTIEGGAKYSSVESTSDGTAYIYMSQRIYTSTAIYNPVLVDEAAPNKAKNGTVEETSSKQLKVSWEPDGDNGTTSLYKVQSYLYEDSDSAATSGPFSSSNLLEESDPYSFEYTSGVYKYYYALNTSSSYKVTTANSSTYNTYVNITQPSQTSYLHVAVMDRAGNLGETYSILINATMDISGTVTWIDNNNAYNTRPDSVTLKLYDGSTYVSSTTVNTTSSNTLTYGFSDLSISDNYVVKIDDVISKTYPQDKYDTTETSKYNFQCKLQNNDGISVKGNITWDDGNNQAGLRPETITIQLSQNNTVYKSTETKDKNISSYSFTGLPKYTYDSDGNVNGTYTYSIKEIFTPVPQVINEDTGKTVDVYTITYSPTSASVDSKDGNGTINIKNTLTPPNAPYILPVKDVINSITVVTNINTYTEVVFKKLEQTLSGDGSVTYGTDYSDIHYNVDVNNIAKTIHDMDAGKYEIEVLNPLYILDNIKLSDSQDVELVKEGDTYYLIIKETDHDTYGTVTINLSKKDHIGYQSGPDTVPDPENPKTEKKTGYTYSNMFKH